MLRTHVLVFAAILSASPLARAQDTAQALTPPPPAAQAPMAPQAPAYPAPYYAPQYGAYPAPYYYPQMPLHRSQRPIVGYRTVERSTTSLWVPGLVTFLAGWVLDFAVATPLANAVSTERDGAAEEDSWAWSLVPLVGPWVQLAIGAPHPAIPVTMGIVQAAGLGLFIAGLAIQESIRVPIYAGDPEDPNAARLDVSAAPTPGGANVALTLRH